MCLLVAAATATPAAAEAALAAVAAAIGALLPGGGHGRETATVALT